MEEKPVSPPTSPGAAQRPVMDVMPPHTPEPESPVASQAGPVAVKAAPAEVPDAETKAPLLDKPRKGQAKDQPKPPSAIKEPKNGVGMAIAATVIIVLGLAVLATYAYLKTQK